MNDVAERRTAEDAEIAPRFRVLPTLEDVKRLYDVAAQIAEIEQHDVVTDRRSDCYTEMTSALLERLKKSSLRKVQKGIRSPRVKAAASHE